MLFEASGPGIALWCLVGCLVLAITGFGIWRFVRRKTDPKPKHAVKTLKSSLITYQIALGFGEVTNFKTMANVLVKNRFAKNGYSLFPVIVFHNGVFFIIANALDGSEQTVHVGRHQQKLNAWYVGRRGGVKPCIDWAFSAYAPMARFISSLDPDARVVKLVPCIGSVSVASGEGDFMFVQLENLYDKVRDVAKQGSERDAALVDKVFNELSKANLFSLKSAAPKKLMRSLME